MMHDFGELALYCALFAASCQTLLPLLGFYRPHNASYFFAIARPAAWAQCFFVSLAYFLLTLAFIRNDFTLAYVAANSHQLLPPLYRLTAVWGAHEGSILLWILLLNGWTCAYATLTPHRTAVTPSPSLTIALLGGLSVCFLSFLLFTSNPFTLTIGQPLGHDLNPLLQDPGFVIHPPILYIGYVGFAVTFALTIAALLQNRLTPAWAHLTKRYTLAAWSFLTLGITLGSWWAYRVLGWGGFWFWDPVENASLLPWLTSTALIHMLVLVEKRNFAINWAVLLAIITFCLSILGTFLVRSGVLISAHTFASDPSRGLFLLLFFALIAIAACIIFLLKSPLSINTPSFHWLSREMNLIVNSLLLMIAMSTILLGTLYPLILDALHLGTISVGAPYFNFVLTPLLLSIMCFMMMAPLCRWQHEPWTVLLKQLSQKIFYSLLAALILLWSTHQSIAIFSVLTLTFSFAIILSLLPTFLTQPAMSLAHCGFALLVVGVLLSSVLSEERQVRVQPGDLTQIGPYQFLFLDTVGIRSSNYHGIRAAFEVTKRERHITNLYPEKRIYQVRDMVMTKVDINAGIFRDLYIALGEPFNQNEWSVRIYYKPFMRWIWAGGLLMMMGGLCALRTFRHKPHS